MSEARRPKRKAAIAANDAIIQIKKQQQQDEEDDRNNSSNGASMEDQQQDKLQQFTDPMPFCGGSVALPQEIMKEILDFLPKKDLVHRASLVSATWNHATKNPFLWPVLDADIWKKYPNRRHGGPPVHMALSSMRQFHLFLERPQFARLVTLVPPDIYRPRFPVFNRISASCPLLEELDLSGSTSIRLNCFVAQPEELVLLPQLFPKLKKLRICMRRLPFSSAFPRAVRF